MLRSEYRDFISQTSMYAVWDDHDFGMNDSAGGEALAPWKIKNLEVFMTDGRFNRSRKGTQPGTMLGAAQKQWLMNGLKHSTAKFKVIGSGTMWTDKADKGGKDSWSGK